MSVLYQRHCAQSFHVLDKFIEEIVGKAHAGYSGGDEFRRRWVSSEVGLSFGERASRRSWDSGNLISSCGRLLAGAEGGCGDCPPTNEGSSEVATSAARLLRRGHPLREVGPSSGERAARRSWASGNHFPPARECWPELSADAEAVLRRTKARRRWQYRSLACSGEGKPYRRWCLPPGNGPLAGVGLPVICCPPAGECWPELGADAEAILRRTRAHRRWQRRPIACSGKDNLYGRWCFPPGNGALAGVEVPVICCPPAGECWPEQARTPLIEAGAFLR